MKRRLLIVIPLLLIVAVGLLTLDRRNSIARDLANRMLADTNLTVVDVDLEELGARRVAFAEIVLTTTKGLRIELRDLEAPLEFPSVTPEHVAIGSVLVSTGTAGDDPPTAITPSVRLVRDLPGQFPATAVTIDELKIDSLPVARNVVWNLAAGLQRLSLDLDGFEVAAELGVPDARGQQLEMTVSTEERPDAVTATAFIEFDGDTSGIRAYFEFDGETALAMASLLDAAPAELESMSGDIVAMLDASFDDESPGRASILTAAATEGELSLLADGRALRGSVSTNSPIEFRTTWPVDGWQLRAPRSSWFADIAGIEQLPVKITSASCEPGPRCELDVELGPVTVRQGELSIERFQATLPLSASFDDALTLELSTAPTWRMTGVTLGNASVGAIIGIGLDGATARFEDGKPKLSIDRMSTNISNVAANDYQLDAVALTATEIAYAAGTLTAKLRVPENSGRVTWDGYRARLPAIDGALTTDMKTIEVDFEASFDISAGSAQGVLQHDLDGRTGTLTINAATLDASALPPEQIITGLPEPLKIISGDLGATGVTRWLFDDNGAEISTELALTADDLAAFWGDVGAAGIDARSDATLSADGLSLENGVTSVDLVEVGTPLVDVRGTFDMPASGAVNVSQLGFRMLGGDVAAAPFTYDRDTGTADVVMQIAGIQLPFMAKMAGFESIEVEGSLSGDVPLRIEGNSVAGGSGTLANDPPGGVIRVDAGTATTLASNAGVELAARALDNFEFNALISDVEYQEDGDLVMKMRLEGINPAMDPNQPIILNLSIENNVPQLLRSLQALRSIEETLESRLGADQ